MEAMKIATLRGAMKNAAIAIVMKNKDEDGYLTLESTINGKRDGDFAQAYFDAQTQAEEWKDHLILDQMVRNRWAKVGTDIVNMWEPPTV